MFVSCDACHYNSGDYDDVDSLASRVQEDGGYMEMQYYRSTPDGWRILCPKNCGEPYTHIMD